MAFTSDQLTALEDAYAAGVTTIHHGNKTLTFASMEKLWEAIVRVRRALRPASTRHLGGVAGYRKYS